MIGRVSVPVSLALGVLLGRADAVWPQARRPPARRPPAQAPAPPALSVRLLKVGLVDGRSARDQRPYGPKASAVVVEIGSPVAGLTARIDRATTTATVGETVLSAAYVFIVGGDSAIVDATAIRDAAAWETVIGTDTRRVLGPAVRPVLDLRGGGWIEYRFARSGILRLAVVFDEYPAGLTSAAVGWERAQAPIPRLPEDWPARLTSAVIAGVTLDIARTRMRLTGQWEGSLAWRGAIGVLRFTVDSVSSEIGDFSLSVTCTDPAGRRRRILPSTQPDLTVNVPTFLAPIRAGGNFAFDDAGALIRGTGTFLTFDSAAGTFTGTTVLGCAGGRRVALRGPWVARRSAPWVPSRPPYTFRVDTVVVPFLIRDPRLHQPRCAEVRDTGDFEMHPAEGGFNVRPPGGQMEVSAGAYCIWPHGAVHRWVGTHNTVAGPIRSIRSDGTAPLRFRVHRDSGYIYVSGKGALTTMDGRVVLLPSGARLVGEDPQVATMRVLSEEPSDTRAVALARPACDHGDMSACALLGWAYSNGRGVEPNFQRAIEFLQRACDGGTMPACARLGGVYRDLSGLRDFARAVELYQRACDGGAMSGCANLGVMYAYGRGVPQGETRAVELFQRACDGGDTQGCANLGLMYGDGRGVARDSVRADRLLRQACESGATSGCGELGEFYKGGWGVAQDDARAVELYRRACEGGDLLGCVRLGSMYAAARGVALSHARAVELYRQACDGGEMEGCSLLGFMFENGYGVARNLERALGLYRQSCDSGDREACDDLRRVSPGVNP